MSNIKIRIVATRKLRPETLTRAEQQGIEVIDLDFLTIEHMPESLAEARLDDPLIFTSAHAVAAFVKQFGKGTGKTCYAISGNTTSQALQAGFLVLGDARDGTSLAELILEKNEEKVIHLCGNIRRSELSKALKDGGVNVVEIEVYHKKPVPRKIEKFDAVLFFSPSQVDAFLQKNVLPAVTPAFCIGKTTAAYVKTLGHDLVFASSESSEKSILAEAMTYFRA